MNTSTPEWVTASIPIFVVLGIWSMIWKAIALYKAGGRKDLAWFVVLFIVNTLGILEIFYIFYFSKRTPVTKK